jgi:hypothetical protein
MENFFVSLQRNIRNGNVDCEEEREGDQNESFVRAQIGWLHISSSLENKATKGSGCSVKGCQKPRKVELQELMVRICYARGSH